jgi:hypothetical protein
MLTFWRAQVALVLAVAAQGCADDSDQVAQTPPSFVTVAPETLDVSPPEPDEPPPVSRPVGELPTVAQPVEDPLRVFRGMFERAGSSNILLVRARITASDVQEKWLPPLIAWGPHEEIATRVELSVIETLCGTPPGATVIAFYVGGMLPGGPGFRTSQMPNDPDMGREYAFWLELLEGEWYLAAGQGSILEVAAPGILTDRHRRRFAAEELAGVCR